MILPALLTGTGLLVCSYRQFFKPWPRLLLALTLLMIIAHVLIIYLSGNNQTSEAEMRNVLSAQDKIPFGSFKNIDFDLVKMGILHLALLTIPFIVNFRKPVPIGPTFE